MKTKILCLSLFCLSIFGCNQGSVETIPSNTVMSSQVFQLYTVEGSRSNMQVVAAFRVGGATGTTLELTAPGKVSYNAAEMPVSAPSNLIGTSYRMKGTDYRISGNEYRAKHDFLFTDNDGKTYANSISLSPLEIVTNSALALQNNQPTTISLSRTVAADEKLTVGIGTSIGDEIPTAGNSIYFNSSRNAIIITPQYWQAKSLRTKTEVEIVVSKSAGITQGSPLGGSISAKYSAAPTAISVSAAKTTSSNKNAIINSNASAIANAAPKTVNANVKNLPKPNSNDLNANIEINKNSPR